MNRSSQNQKYIFINVDSNKLVKYALYINVISYIYHYTLYISIKLKILTQEYTCIMYVLYSLTEYILKQIHYIIQMETIKVYSIKLVPFQPLEVSLPNNPDCCPSNIPSQYYLMPLVNLECIDTCKNRYDRIILLESVQFNSIDNLINSESLKV